MDPEKLGLHALTPRLRAIPRPDPFATPASPEGSSGGVREKTPARSADAIRVFLIEPYALLRHALRMLLASEGDIEIVGEAGSAGSAVEEVAASNPDVVLMEVAAPAGGRDAAGGPAADRPADGISAIRAIKTRCPATQVLVLTAQTDQEIFREAAAAGAVGYVLKDISPVNLSNAIRAVQSGATMINPVLARQMVEGLAQDDAAGAGGAPRRPHRLTPRETNIFVKVALGLGDKEIAVKLGLSESRVKNCLRALYGRLSLRNRAHAAAFAVRRGLV